LRQSTQAFRIKEKWLSGSAPWRPEAGQAGSWGAVLNLEEIYMQKKLLAAAVLAALSGTAAAQSTAVTISAVLAAEFAQVSASGATQNGTAGSLNSDVVSRTRLQDGNGSWLRFAATEDLGNGLAAWVQLESAVFGSFDTRAQNTNTIATPGILAGTSTFASRNSGVGLRSNTWGSFVMGIWDIHYHTEGGVESFAATAGGVSSAGSKSLLHNMGANTQTAGGRLSNVIRYETPNFNGFALNVSYARPSDAAVRTVSANVGTSSNIIDGKKNTVWSFNPTYSNGPITAFYSYYKETDLVDAAAGNAANGNLATQLAGYAAAAVPGATTAAVASALSAGTPAAALAPAIQTVASTRGDRLGGAWTFPFGLKVGLIWDRLKYSNNHQATAGVAIGGVAIAAGQSFNSDQKRTVWSIPLSYNVGNHGFGFTYAKASKIDGSIGVTGVGFDGSQFGAKYVTLGYQYAFSKRTNLFASYSKISNDALANYDYFANGVGMNQTNRGADPQSIGIGLRHTF
jgi:predicted porin